LIDEREDQMKFTIVALASILLTALPAAGHEVEKGPNGGRVVEASAHHVELVVKDNAVNVFVTDANEKPVSINGFTGVAIFTISGKAQRIPLEPKEGTRLSGTSPVALPAEPVGVVQITAPDGKTAQGRFH
jgi:hypothetical protein